MPSSDEARLKEAEKQVRIVADDHDDPDPFFEVADRIAALIDDLDAE